MKKILLTFLLGFSSIAFATKPHPPTSVPVAPVASPTADSEDAKVISSQNFFISKSYDENNVPQDLKKWLPWVNKDNYTQNCVDAICTFIPKLTISKNTHYNFVFEGTSLAKEAWVPLPSSDTAWPISVLLNGQKVIIVNHDDKPFIQVPQKDFKIEAVYNTNIFDKDSSFELPFNVVSFDNQTGQTLSLKDTTLSLNDIAATTEKNDFQELKVFRKFTDNIPYNLETNIQINFSGKVKEIDLGTVMPQDFKLTQINSDLKVVFKNNHYFVTVIPGSHFVNFKSFANKEISSFSVKGLVTTIDSEVWSIQKNNDIRNIDIDGSGSNVVDPKQVSVPQEWVALPAYLITDKLNLHTSQQGLSLNTDLKINATRSSIFGFDGNIYSMDNVTLVNQNSKELKFNPHIVLQSVKLSQPKMILNDTKNSQNYILLNSNDTTGRVQFDTTNSDSIASQLAPSYYVDSWTTYFTPRTELLWATNAKITSPNFWFNAWDLYSLFSLSILVIALYKLVGKEAAFFALFSLVSFYANNSVFWIFWVLLVIAYAFNNYLPEKYINFKRNTNSISLIGTILVLIFSFEFIFNEIFSLIHPNVAIRFDFSPLFYFISISILFIAYKLLKGALGSKFFSRHKVIGWILGIIMVIFLFNFLVGVSKSTTTGSGIASSSLRYIDGQDSAPAAAAASASASSPESLDNPDYVGEKRRQRKSDKEVQSLENIAMSAPAIAAPELPKLQSAIKRNVAQEKVQVGHAEIDPRSLHTYDLKPSNKDAVSFYIAPKWLVNIYGVIQCIFLLLLAYILVIYNILVFKKENLLSKLPVRLQENFLTKKIKSKINEA